MAKSPKKKRQPPRLSKDKSKYAPKKTAPETRSGMHGLDFNLGYYYLDPNHPLYVGYPGDHPDKKGDFGDYYKFDPKKFSGATKRRSRNYSRKNRSRR